MKNKEFLFKLLENEISKHNYQSLYLIDQIDDINMQCEEYGNTLLHICAEYNNVTFAKQLLDLGANPNIKNRYGYTPVQEAARRCHNDIFLLLFMRKDVDKYQLTKNKEDLLHIIYYNRYVGYIDTIVYNNRELNDLSLKDKYGNTPLDLMVEHSVYEWYVINNILDEREKHIFYFYKKDKNYDNNIQKKVLEKIILKDYLLGKAVISKNYEAIKHLVGLAKSYSLDMKHLKKSVTDYITKQRQQKIEMYVNDDGYMFFEMCLNKKHII